MSAAAFTSSTDVSLIRAISVPPSGELCDVGERKTIRHARDELDDLLGILTALHAVVEDAADGRPGTLLFQPRMRTEIDVVEHEPSESEHRFADLLALHDVAGLLGAFDQIVHKGVDAARAAISEQRDLGLWQRGGIENPEADRVVDVVVDVGDAVDDPDDLAFLRQRRLRAGMREDPVADL